MDLAYKIKRLWKKHTGKKAIISFARDKTGWHILTHALDRPDKNPSLSIYVPFNGRPVVRDFAKGDKWVDLVGYTMQYNPALADELEATIQEEQKWQGKPDDRPRKKTLVPSYEPQSPLKERPFVPLSDAQRSTAITYIANLRFYDPRRGESYAYLKERLPYATIQDYMRLAEWRTGVDEYGNVCFPSYLPDENGNLVIVNYQVRLRQGEPRYRFMFPGHPPGLFICGNMESPTEVWIYEGPFDAVTGALEVAPQAMHIATHGASNTIPANFTPMMRELAEKGVRFVVVGDRDEAGEKWRYEIINTLILMGVPEEQILVAALDNLGRDLNEQVNDLHKNGTPRAKVRELMLAKLSPKPMRRNRSSLNSLVGGAATTGAIGVDRAHRSIAIALGLGLFRMPLARTPTRTKAPFVLGLIHALWFIFRYMLPKRVRSRLEKNAWLAAEYPKIVRDVMASNPVLREAVLIASVGAVEGREAFRTYDRMRSIGLDKFAGLLEWTKKGNEYCKVWAIDPNAILKEFAERLAEAIRNWEPPTEEEKRYLKELTDAYAGKKEEMPEPPKKEAMSLLAQWRIKVRKLVAWFRLEREMFYGRVSAPSAVAVPVPAG